MVDEAAVDPDPARAAFLQRDHAELRARDHRFHVPVLFAAVPAEVEAVEILQKGCRERAQDEGYPGPDQGYAEKGRPDRRPANACPPDGTAKADEGRAADRRLPPDAAAVPAAHRIL